MKVQLNLQMRPQPNDESCGPTCLHALYRYYEDRIPLETVIREVPRLAGGGTLGMTMDRVIGAILLGIVTYDANLLVIRPR